MNVEIFKAGKNWIAVERHNGMEMVVCRAKTKKALLEALEDVAQGEFIKALHNINVVWLPTTAEEEPPF